jgi:hypothetical protein
MSYRANSTGESLRWRKGKPLCLGVDVSLLVFGIIGLLAYMMVVGNPSARPPRAFGPDSPKNVPSFWTS